MADKKRPFACPECGGKLEYVTQVEMNYAINPRTGSISSRPRRGWESGDSEGRCSDCDKLFWVERSDDRKKVVVIEPERG